MDDDSASGDVRAAFPAGFDAVADYRFPSQHAGIAIYIGFDDATAAAAGTDVRRVADLLASVVDQLAPGAERDVTVVPAAPGGTGSNLDIVRRAAASAGDRVPSAEPGSAAARRAAPVRRLRPRTPAVVVDISRHRITIDDSPVSVTFTEFELLRALVERGDGALTRDELLGRLPGDGESRSARAVDDVVRRLRHKLEPHDDLIRTVRGVGYRFHPHDGVEVRRDAPGTAPARGRTP
jgi:DNA-binding winged helix-turn-helix (wHTH) protein